MIRHLTPSARRWITVGLTLAVAFFTGHLMQSPRSETVMLQPTVTPDNFPNPPAVASALNVPPRLNDRIVETRAERKGSCRANLTLEETPAGFLSILLTAPCHADTALTLQINELTATDKTDARGSWEARLPALARVSMVKVSLSDITLSRNLNHEIATNQQHIILGWTGAQTFHIRVDDASNLPRSLADDAVVGTFTRLGDGTGAAFEIFTFPSETAGAKGVLRVSVDAVVTSKNCSKTARTQAYQTGFLGTLRPTEIAYTMPECSRIGEVVRLQNLFRDLRLALR
ncbi:MAG: hypothetical protein AAGA06_03455 [Pseudomonadota bacterium]